jgi:hypothetical protein
MSKAPKPVQVVFNVIDEDAQDGLDMIFKFVEKAIRGKTFAQDERLQNRVGRLPAERAKITDALLQDAHFWHFRPDAWDWGFVLATGKWRWSITFDPPANEHDRMDFENTMLAWLMAMGAVNTAIPGHPQASQRKQLDVHFCVIDQACADHLALLLESAGEARLELTFDEDEALIAVLEQLPTASAEATKTLLADELFWGLHPEFGAGEGGWEIAFTVEGTPQEIETYGQKLTLWLTSMGASDVRVVDAGAALDEE